MSLEYIWPPDNDDFFKINNYDNVVKIEWTKDLFVDYSKLAEDFWNCGYSVLKEVVDSGHNNVKSDMWFLTGIFLVRQSIELLIKALLISSVDKRNITTLFMDYKHNLSGLFCYYDSVSTNSYLNEDEKIWIKKYLESLEEVDEKSDMFRFPFDDEFLEKYQNKFLDNVCVANNMFQAYFLIRKCINKGDTGDGGGFDQELEPFFFVFASDGIGNCMLYQGISDCGFHSKIKGYVDVLEYLYSCESIEWNVKIYPLLFVGRNAIELCLKRLFYSRVENGVPRYIFFF